MLERDIHNGLVKYIKLQYPQAYIHSGLEGLHLPQKARLTIIKQGGQRGYPDLSIYLNGTALHIELKREGTRLKKKNGEWASEHIAEQAKWLSVLSECNRDAFCYFAIGFDAAKAIIDYVFQVIRTTIFSFNATNVTAEYCDLRNAGKIVRI